MVESDAFEVHFLNNGIKLGSLKHLHRIAVDKEHFIRLDFSMAGLYVSPFVLEAFSLAFFIVPEVAFKSLDFFLPFFADDSDDVVVLF